MTVGIDVVRPEAHSSQNFAGSHFTVSATARAVGGWVAEAGGLSTPEHELERGALDPDDEPLLAVLFSGRWIF